MSLHDRLESEAEGQAQQAENLSAFGGFKLAHVKRAVAKLLGMIGREGIFDEYTTHDISHINTMCETLSWLVPESCRADLTPADWLLCTLSIYFHDLGMLVTRREFDARLQSGFVDFRNDILYSGPAGRDYRAKIESLPDDRRERFLYQEFVRHTHAARIRTWIIGSPESSMGVTKEVASTVSALLSPLPRKFVKDLATICESHHLTDLDDVKKYPTNQPYGPSKLETANVQYAAILLRTTDLLHITSNRTPSVTYHAISPTDPISQDEWAKQRAVLSVRPKPKRDEDGKVDRSHVSDAIEIRAYFTQPEGFFGLTAYINYARDQLRQSFSWARTSSERDDIPHSFPWRSIDDTDIEAEGFLPRSYQFTFDQTRVLDLLTGHTLYNDAAVVLRELVQNSLDAISFFRVEQDRSGVTNITPGSVSIKWASSSNQLTVTDNGSGMTLGIIEEHFLRVGSSFYESEQTKKQYPEFQAISRFGIGVLSAFMIADRVDLLTVHPEDEFARSLTLRSVHGKYLLREISKSSPEVAHLGSHGTEIALSLRPSVGIPDVAETARRWFIIPEHRISVSIDGKEEGPIGHTSAQAALTHMLREREYIVVDDETPSPDLSISNKCARVVQKDYGGIQVAFAVIWNHFLREWELLDAKALAGHDYGKLSERLAVRVNLSSVFFDDGLPWESKDSEKSFLPIATCIGGIRVESGTPGYTGIRFCALTNAAGRGAPRTNVARSEIEDSKELRDLHGRMYEAYVGHIEAEIERLSREKRSLTWATTESYFLLRPLLVGSEEGYNKARFPGPLAKAVRSLAYILVEIGESRQRVSPLDLDAHPAIWTIAGRLFSSAESLISELGVAVSAHALLRVAGGKMPALPDEPILCGALKSGERLSAALESRVVDLISIHAENRRVDFRWVAKGNQNLWLDFAEAGPDGTRVYEGLSVGAMGVNLQAGEVTVQGGGVVCAVRQLDSVYFFRDTAEWEWLTGIWRRWADAGSPELRNIWVQLVSVVLVLVGAIPTNRGTYRKRSVQTKKVSSQGIYAAMMSQEDQSVRFRFSESALAEVDFEEASNAVRQFSWEIYDPAVWYRED